MSTKAQSYKEEILNTLTHGFGIIAGFIATIIMLSHALMTNDDWYIWSSFTFCITLILLYSSSTIYHSYTGSRLKQLLRKFDHSAIFLFIAGTYTPFTLVTLRNEGAWGWILFGIIWGAAILGTIISFCYMKGSILKTICYLLMGWIVVVAIKPLYISLQQTNSIDVFYWLITGGIFYTLGTIFFSLDKIKYMHAVWHMFVLAGSVSHFIAIYQIYNA
ncbi:MAG: PAQR family membrane homeostasis protein TrhA [Bacteroidales bacterium]